MNGPYREPAPAPPDRYAVAWQKLAWRRRVLRALVLIVLFAFVAPALVYAPFVDGPAALIATAVTLALPTVLLVLSVVPPVACPCCQRPFFSSVVTAMGTGASCSSCTIAIGTSASQAPVAGALRVTASAVHPPSRLRLVVWLGVALLSALIGFELGESSAQPSSFVAAVSVAAFVTTLAAAAMKSRAFPRAWLVPIAALFFASLVGSGVTRARRQLVRRCDLTTRIVGTRT
jgi:hypothetical protein